MNNETAPTRRQSNEAPYDDTRLLSIYLGDAVCLIPSTDANEAPLDVHDKDN